MKVIKKLGAILLVLSIAVSCFLIPASADEALDTASKGVVYVTADFDGSADSYALNVGGMVVPVPVGMVWRMAGSGFVVGELEDDARYIVTNAHVVTDEHDKLATTITVWFSEKANKFMIAEVRHIDTVRDICILELPEESSERAPIALCDIETVSVGDKVYALGYPDYGTAGQNYTKNDVSDLMVTQGIVSKLTRHNFTSDVGVDAVMSDVQTSHGNSGGPLINENGAVIGINTYVTTSAASESANSAIAITTKELIPILKSLDVPYELYNADGSESDEDDDEDDDKKSSGSLEIDFSDSNTIIILIVVAAALVIAIILIAVIVSTNKKKSAKAPAPQQPVQQSMMQQPVQQPVKPANAIIKGESGLFNGRVFNIDNKIVLGRKPDRCVVCYPVDAKGISGVHCEIRKNGTGYEIVDLGSSHGTFLGNGQKLIPNVPVQVTNGTYFYLGSSEQMFQIKID